MIRIAILVDGGYYRKRASNIFGKKTAMDRADELIQYCYCHVKGQYLYRIFYYDCPPLDKRTQHPLGHCIDFKTTETYRWTNDLFNKLKRKRKVALRMGKLSEEKLEYRIKQDSLKKLIAGKISVTSLTADDFEVAFKQKGVDMKIGLDISSLAYKHQVDRIVLIAGDSDFVPAAKHARREGIDFILDPMGQKVNDDLFEHLDGMKSYWRTFQAAAPDNAPTSTLDCKE